MSKVIENYILEKVIGSGQYGKVYRATNSNDGMVVAVKVIKLDKFKEVKKLYEFTLNEINTLSRIDNENVIKFIEMLKTSNNMYLVYEFCSGGTLEQLLEQKKSLKEEEALPIALNLAKAFHKLNALNILHRDIKPSNILFHEGIVKIADFGFCKCLSSASELTQTMVGSPIYMAPEILKGLSYTTKADVWSFGVVLFEMLFGFCPFEEKSIGRLINLIDTHELVIPPGLSPAIERLLKGMLTVDYTRRFEWDMILNSLLEASDLFERRSTLQLPQIGAPIGASSGFQANAYFLQGIQPKPLNKNLAGNSNAYAEYSPPGFSLHQGYNTQANFSSSNSPGAKSNSSVSGMFWDSNQKNNDKPVLTSASNMFRTGPSVQTNLRGGLDEPKPSAYGNGSNITALRNLMKERNKILFLANTVGACLELNLSKNITPYLTMCLVKYARYLSKELKACLGNLLSKENLEEFTRSFECKSFMAVFEKEVSEINEFYEAFHREITTYFVKKSYEGERNPRLVQIEQELKENKVPNLSLVKELALDYVNSILADAELENKILLHCNELLDSLWLDELFENFIDANFKFSDQKYFESLQGHDKRSLREIVLSKTTLLKNK